MTTRILAIETSCDETSAAVVADGRTVLSNIIATQTDLHAQYGGVFPEVASRRHIEVIYPVIARALREAHLGINDLDAVAVTRGPGLVGSLLVGVNAAKGIALATGLPLIGVNHIEGHIYALWLTAAAEVATFPLLNLVVSGGHTELYLMTDHLTHQHLGGTLDDAAGEAFDKIGRLLNLPWPGGPHIERIAREGNPHAFRFPRAVLNDGYNFSFSGLKTAVMREIQRYNHRVPVADLAAAFQDAVVEVLVTKTAAAAQAHGAGAVHLSGGVSANSALRSRMAAALTLPVRWPPLDLCTDNAAMIGAAAHYILQARQGDRNRTDPLNFDVLPGLQLA